LAGATETVLPQTLWQVLQSATPPLVIDVREPREFQQGHIPQAKSLPLSQLFSTALGTSRQDVVLVCRSGKRSAQAAAYLTLYHRGRIQILQGGMLAWEGAGLRESS
jgi:SulP family sulfate permease